MTAVVDASETQWDEVAQCGPCVLAYEEEVGCLPSQPLQAIARQPGHRPELLGTSLNVEHWPFQAGVATVVDY